MDIEKLLTNTFVIGNAKNIDPRYFKEGDKPGEYKLTYTFVYNIIRDALDFYKDQIFAQDTECLYHTEKMGVFKDTWAEKRNSEEMKLLYGEQFKEFEARKRKWREANPDKCEVRHGPVDLGDEDEMHFFAGYSPDFKPTLTQAVALYKYLKAYDTEHGDSLKATLPTKPDYLVVSSQYSDEYKALCDEWAKELGLPLETKQVGTVNRTKYSIKRVDSANFKQISASSDGLQDWVYGLISKPYDKKYDLPAEMTNTDGITGIDVDRNTIGMWTGKVDCEENCIFENDILQDTDTGEIVIVQWFEEHIAFMVWRTSINKIEFLYSFLEGKKLKIVGNEFDNNDLIDKGMEQFIIPKER